MRAHHQTRSPSRSWKAGLVRQASALLQENDQQNVTLHRSQLSNMN